MTICHSARISVRRIFNWIAPLLLLFLVAPQVPAQLLDYAPFAGYSLRKGILGNDYQHPKSACITGTESPLPASDSSTRVSIVASENDYKRAFHIDEKAEASYLGFGGGGEEFHFGQEESGKASAFDIIVESYGQHDGRTLDDVKWNPPYDGMMQSGAPDQIARVRLDCGDRYIESEFYEYRLFVVIHVSKTMNTSLTSYSGSATGNVGLSVVSAKASLGGDATISAANKAGALSLDVYAEGIDQAAIPVSAAALGITDADGLDGIAAKLGEALAKITIKGQPVKYQLARLPGMPDGDFLDDQVVERLEELKNDYLITAGRLSNVRSLMQSGDQRRLLFREPEADAALSKQRDVLTAYSNAVADAHEVCRTALKLMTCAAKADQVGTSPPKVSVELPPVTAPMIGLYFFAIDGVPVPQGQDTDLISQSGSTLLDAARKIKPDARNVDLLAAVLGGEYVASIDVSPFGPGKDPTVPVALGIGRRLGGQAFGWPKYWRDKSAPGVAIHVIHADANEPCPIRMGGGLYYLDESCLTIVGRALRDVALANVAQYASKGATGTFDLGLTAAASNCFGQYSPLPMAGMHFTVVTSGDSITVNLGLFLMMGNIQLPLIEKEETNPTVSWPDIAQARLATATSTTGSSSGQSPCSPRFP